MSPLPDEQGSPAEKHSSATRKTSRFCVDMKLGLWEICLCLQAAPTVVTNGLQLAKAGAVLLFRGQRGFVARSSGTNAAWITASMASRRDLNRPSAIALSIPSRARSWTKTVVSTNPASCRRDRIAAMRGADF